MHLPWLPWLQASQFVQPQFQRFRVVGFDSGTGLQGWHSKLHIMSLLQVPIGHLGRTDLFFLAFALCRLVAYSKLCICFITKLCGCGVGEQSSCKLMCESDSCDKFGKVITCIIGLIASGICLVLTIMSITYGFKAPASIFTSVAACFHAAKTE